jgi:hypothetical protein
MLKSFEIASHKSSARIREGMELSRTLPWPNGHRFFQFDPIDHLFRGSFGSDPNILDNIITVWITIMPPDAPGIWLKSIRQEHYDFSGWRLLVLLPLPVNGW